MEEFEKLRGKADNEKPNQKSPWVVGWHINQGGN